MENSDITLDGVEIYDVLVENNNPKDSQRNISVATSIFQEEGELSDSVISIRQMLSSVNDSLGNPYYQQHRGSITFPRQAGQPIRISWSKNADASTVIHELAHFYLWQLRQFRSTPSVAIGRYGRQATDDLDLISNWWSEDAGQITDWIQKQAGMSVLVL